MIEGYTTRGDGERIPTALAERIIRGIDHYSEHGDRIEDLGGGKFWIPSRRFPNQGYEVTVTDEGEDCPCVDFRRDKHKPNPLEACLHTVTALIASAKSPAVVLEFHQDLHEVDGGHWGAGYVVVETLKYGSVGEHLPSGNFRFYSKANVGRRRIGQKVGTYRTRKEATVARWKLEGREAA